MLRQVDEERDRNAIAGTLSDEGTVAQRDASIVAIAPHRAHPNPRKPPTVRPVVIAA